MDNQNTEQKSNNATMGILVIALVVITALGVYVFQSQSKKAPMVAETQTTTTPSPVTDAMVQEPSGAMTASDYKDGEYTAVGDYVSPGGEEQVGVTLTLENGVISAVEFEQMAERPASVMFQEKFAGGYKELVVGKNIDEVQLTKVSGSSLTPKGFNDALQKIKAEASNS